MQILDNLRASDGTGNAVLANVTILRTTGATVIKVDSVSKWPTVSFIGTYGTRGADGYLTSASVVEFVGHITSGDIIIDSFEPGFTDAGNSVGQVVVVKQTVGWANRVKTALDEVQLEDQTRSLHNTADFVQTGGIWTLISGFNASMTAVTAYQAGLRATLAAIASRAYTPSKDTYVDLLRGGTALTPTFTAVYTEVANAAASPALAANSLRIAKVVTSGAAITSILQAGLDSVTTNGQLNYIYNTQPSATPTFTAPNAGTAGGSWYYKNTAGQKEAWLTTANLTANSSGGSTYTFNPPTNFFQVVTAAFAFGINQTTLGEQYVNLASGLSSSSMNLRSFVTAGSGTQGICFRCIGY